MVTRAICATLSVLLLSPLRGAAEQPSGRIVSVLSYNVHGLFALIAKDDPRDRMPTIGWLANHYDVVAFQEDFEYHDILRAQMTRSVGALGNDMGWDPRHVGLKLLIAPVTMFLPHVSPPYGAGISTFVGADIALAEMAAREAYGICNGWFGQNGDCWARKGYLRVAFRAPNGARVDVYNTHLEAGPSPRSVDVRTRQLAFMAAAIERLSRDTAVIVAGDFNVSFSRPGDRDAIVGFRDRLGLADSGAGPELPQWRERDYILYRGGADVDLEVVEAGEALEFVGHGRALSDHPALLARFAFRAPTSRPAD